jgi:hypothetical protein
MAQQRAQWQVAAEREVAARAEEVARSRACCEMLTSAAGNSITVGRERGASHRADTAGERAHRQHTSNAAHTAHAAACRSERHWRQQSRATRTGDARHAACQQRAHSAGEHCDTQAAHGRRVSRCGSLVGVHQRTRQFHCAPAWRRRVREKFELARAHECECLCSASPAASAHRVKVGTR